MDQQATAAGTLDLNFNYPALPGQAELLRGALRQLASSGDLETLLRYQPHAGRLHERAQVARYLACRGLPVEAERVLMVSGAQHGLSIAAMALLKPGDVVATDALTYPGFKVVADAHGLELLAIPLTPRGPDLAAFERLCRQRRVRAVYAMPTLHNPMGWVLDLPWRQRLVAIAREQRLLIIEDGAYAFLAENPPAPWPPWPRTSRFMCPVFPRTLQRACGWVTWWPRRPGRSGSSGRSAPRPGAIPG